MNEKMRLWVLDKQGMSYTYNFDKTNLKLYTN